jgi:hypothetical protein
MELLQAAIALLASMVFVLAGMIGWVYWQQARLRSSLNTLEMHFVALTQQLVIDEPPPPEPAPVPEPEPEVEDDRASVEEEQAVETVEGPPPALDLDTLEGRTKKELQELLTKRGLPFGKNDAKGVLISLLKASS